MPGCDDLQNKEKETRLAPDRINIKEKLDEFGLNSDNSIVIGSGVLNALGIRSSHDIDVLTVKEKYESLAKSDRFEAKENHGREVLAVGLVEVMTNWIIDGKEWKFDNLFEQSVIIDNVRYVSIQFLLNVKKSWVANDSHARQIDIDDIKLMESYLNS